MWRQDRFEDRLAYVVGAAGDVERELGGERLVAEDNSGGGFIVGGAGADLLLGGASDDQIGDPGPGAWVDIRCGDGVDFVEASPDDAVPADCERVERT